MIDPPLSNDGATPIDANSPAERRKRKVRDTIIEAAEAVFAEDGEQGLSMRRLAERADYSPAAIYKYFRSKDDVIHAIREQFFERLIERLNAYLDQNLGADGPSQLCFRSCLKIYIETGLERPNHYRLALADPGAHDAPEEGTRTFEAAKMLEQMITSLVERGDFRTVDPTLASKSVWAAIHGVTILMAEHGDFPHGMKGAEHVSRDSLIDFHVDLIERGLIRV